VGQQINPRRVRFRRRKMKQGRKGRREEKMEVGQGQSRMCLHQTSGFSCQRESKVLIKDKAEWHGPTLSLMGRAQE
jgi:hypothetical protein